MGWVNDLAAINCGRAERGLPPLVSPIPRRKQSGGNMITPSKLHAKLTSILAQESGCPASWEQHLEPLTTIELTRIGIRLWFELAGHVEEARLEESHGHPQSLPAPARPPRPGSGPGESSTSAARHRRGG